MELTRTRWIEEGKPTATVFPERIQVASDYLRLAHALLDNSELQLNLCVIESLQPYTVTLYATTARGAQYNNAASILLRENWFYDWMPVTTRIEFF